MTMLDAGGNEPTPGELHELAAAAEQLAAKVDQLRARFGASPETGPLVWRQRPGAPAGPVGDREGVAAADGLLAAVGVDQHGGHRARRRAARPVRRAGFRLDDVAGELRRAGREFGAAAADLERTLTALDPALCPAEWGVCPEHGNTLLSTGGRSRCQVDGREWDYDRLPGLADITRARRRGCRRGSGRGRPVLAWDSRG